MQIYSRLIWLLLAFAFVLIHARDIQWNDDDDDFNRNEQRRYLYFHKKSPLITKKFFNKMIGEYFNPNDQDQLSPMARRVKAIIKGDPREFMG